MAAVIRQATMEDAPRWIELLRATLGDDYPDKEVYNPGWAVGQFSPTADVETWVVESQGRLETSVTFLPRNLSRRIRRATFWQR